MTSLRPRPSPSSTGIRMKTTTLPAGRDPRWPAGRPASPLSAFCQVAELSGSTIGAALQVHATKRATSTPPVERARAEGSDRSTLHGLNKVSPLAGPTPRPKPLLGKERSRHEH